MPGKKLLLPLLLLALYFGGRAWYFTPTVGGTQMATNFTAVRADGKRFQLTDLHGKYVLLDFWGSWCGPCRRESPQLVKMHAQTKGRLTIVSIAIERDSTAWRRSRTRDARNWPFQVMETTASLKFLNGKVADLYGVNKVPTNFLIGPDGVIVGVDVPLADIPALMH